MGTFTVTIEIGDVHGRRFDELDVEVDDSVMPTVIPASALLRVGIVPTKREVFEYPDGKQVELGMAQAIVRVQGRETHTWVVFGEESRNATLGKFTLSGLFLRVDAETRRLVPAHGMLATPVLVDRS